MTVGASVVSRTSVVPKWTQAQLEHYLASVSQRSTNQIVKKYDLRN